MTTTEELLARIEAIEAHLARTPRNLPNRPYLASVDMFLDICTYSSNYRIRKHKLHEAYVQYCRDHGLRPAAPNTFGRFLRPRGVVPGGNGRRDYYGISLPS